MVQNKTLQLNFFEVTGQQQEGLSPVPAPWSGPLTAGLLILTFWTSWPKSKPRRSKLEQKQPLERYGWSHAGLCSCSIALHYSSPLLELWVLSFAVMNQIIELNVRKLFNIFLHEERNTKCFYFWLKTNKQFQRCIRHKI